MESILFLKEIRKKGSLYKDVWINILLQYEPNSPKIKLSVPIGIHPSTYHKIVTFGIEIFAVICQEHYIVKDRMSLIIEKKPEGFIPIPLIVKKYKPRKKIEPVIENEEQIVVLESKKEESFKILPLLFSESESKTNETPVAKSKRKNKNKTVEVLPIHIEIITHLNECAGTNYQFDTKTTLDLINEKLKQGFTVDNLKYVIEVKSTKWLNTKYQDYLTPSTLFGHKFENYLNETIAVKNIKQQKAYDTVNQATELGWNSKN